MKDMKNKQQRKYPYVKSVTGKDIQHDNVGTIRRTKHKTWQIKKHKWHNGIHHNIIDQWTVQQQGTILFHFRTRSINLRIKDSILLSLCLHMHSRPKDQRGQGRGNQKDFPLPKIKTHHMCRWYMHPLKIQSNGLVGGERKDIVGPHHVQNVEIMVTLQNGVQFQFLKFLIKCPLHQINFWGKEKAKDQIGRLIFKIRQHPQIIGHHLFQETGPSQEHNRGVRKVQGSIFWAKWNPKWRKRGTKVEPLCSAILRTTSSILDETRSYDGRRQTRSLWWILFSFLSWGPPHLITIHFIHINTQPPR